MLRLFLAFIAISSAQATSYSSSSSSSSFSSPSSPSSSSSSSSETADDLTTILDEMSSAESELSYDDNKSYETKKYYKWLFNQDKKRLAKLFYEEISKEEKDQVKYFENMLQYVKKLGKTNQVK